MLCLKALGLHTAGCRLPAPQSLLTLMSGPPLPPLPPFPLPCSGKYIRDRTSEQKLLLLLLLRGSQSEMTGFLRLMLGDAAAAAKGETAASPQAWGQETSYRAPKNHACNLGWQFRGQPGEGTKGQRGPQLSDPRLLL